MNPQQKGNRSGKVLQSLPRIICADFFFPLWLGQLPHFPSFSVHFAWTLMAKASAKCACGLAEVFVEGKSELPPCKTSGTDLSDTRQAYAVKQQGWQQVTKPGRLIEEDCKYEETMPLSKRNLGSGWMGELQRNFDTAVNVPSSRRETVVIYWTNCSSC